MSLQACARAAATTFPAVTVQTPAGALPLRAVMVSIAGAETGGSWVDNAAGDPLSIYSDGGASEAAYSCGGRTSFGLWQINLPAHYPYLRSATGSASPCSWATWLYNPGNCALAALAVYRSQGLGAWTTYQTGAWRAYLPQAQAAVAAVQPPPARGGGVLSSLPAATPVVAGIGVAILAVVAIEAGAAELVVGWFKRRPGRATA